MLPKVVEVTFLFIVCHHIFKYKQPPRSLRVIATMRAEVRFAFLSEGEKRRLVRLCLNHVKLVRSPQAKLVKLDCQTGFLECEHLFIDEPMLRTKPPVASTRLLGLGSKLYPSQMPSMLNKDLTRFIVSLSRVRHSRLC